MTATGAEVFWWVVLPYLALGVFAVGHVWRWRYDQFGWTSRSTQLQERRMLKWGSPLTDGLSSPRRPEIPITGGALTTTAGRLRRTGARGAA
jgi:hypothetical protein